MNTKKACQCRTFVWIVSVSISLVGLGCQSDNKESKMPSTTNVQERKQDQGKDRKANPTMKLICDREQLLSAFQTAAAVAPSRSPKPVLQNVKIEAAKEGVMLLATDLEVGIRIQV